MRPSTLLPLLGILSVVGAVPVREQGAVAPRNNWQEGDNHDDGYGNHHEGDDNYHGGGDNKHDDDHDDKWGNGDGKHGGKHDDDHGHGRGKGGKWGEGGNGDKGDKGGKGGKDGCLDSDDPEKAVDWILKNPNVETTFKLPDTVNKGTMIDLVNKGTIPATNSTSRLIDTLPALKNESEPATLFGGITSKDFLNFTVRPPLQGTNKNAAVFGGGGGFRAFAAPNPNLPDANTRRVTIGAQPDPPTPNSNASLRCEYKYEHVLGGNGTVSKGALWALEGYVNLVAADVRQGGIGDCGMGAAVMALAAGGWTRYLTAMFIKRFDTPNVGDKTMVAIFKKDGSTYPVLIDDQLPVLQNYNPNCWPYPGYQPVNDAAEPGPLGNYPPTPIFFMPLFEKAYAKFLDFMPDWKAALPTTRGYEGLEGVPPHYVLAAITGGTPKATIRTKPGFDGPILVALLTCMRGLAPCVIGTTNSTTLEGLGTMNEFKSIWLNPDGVSPSNYVPGETSGMLSTDAPGSEHTYTIIDFDQIVKTPEGDRSTAITMVGNHAYAFGWQRSTRFPLSDLVSSHINILNPWGNNPHMWPGGGGVGAFDDPAEVTHSFRSFAQTVGGVYTVTDMPVI